MEELETSKGDSVCSNGLAFRKDGRVQLHIPVHVQSTSRLSESARTEANFKKKVAHSLSCVSEVTYDDTELSSSNLSR